MKRFVAHYLEMVAAMLLGMAALYMPLSLAFELGHAAALLVMGAAMTVPMVAWMRYRGHGWRACAEMSAAMLLPTAVAISLLGSADFMTLMMGEHIAMPIAMLVAMLLRPAEYHLAV